MRPSHSLSYRPTHTTPSAKHPWRLLLTTSISLLGLQTLFLGSPRAIAHPFPRPPAPIPERVLHLNPEPEPYGELLVLEEPKSLPHKQRLSPPQSNPAIGLKQTDTNDVDTVLLSVDEALTDDDDTLDDGSRYDAHPFQGQAGQIITISLSSDAFDAYLLLEDPSGERIAENDDSGDNTNAQIVVQLPADGTYRILANAFDETGRGPYRLTIAPATDEDLRLAQIRSQADQLYSTGVEQYNAQLWREAIQSFQAALEHFQEIGNLKFESYSLNYLGLLHRFLGEYPQALEHHQQSLVISTEQGDRSFETSNLINIGVLYRLLGDYPQSLHYYGQSLIIAREIGDRANEANSLYGTGGVYSNLGDYPQALNYYQQSLPILRDIGDRAGEARTLGNIGIVYRLLGDYPQALDYHQQSLLISQDIGNRAGEAITLGNIGIVYDLLGDYPLALDFYQQSLLISQDIGNRAGEASTLGNIGIVYRLLGDYPQALDYHQQSLIISQDIGNRAGEAITLGNIGNVYQLLGDYHQALDYHQQSLLIKQDIGNRAGEAITLGNIGGLFDAQDQPELAIVFLKQSVNTYELIREQNQALTPDEQASYTTTIEETYRQLADLLLKQNRVFEAQRVLDLLKVQELDSFLRGVRSTDDSVQGIETLSPEQQIIARYQALLNRAIEIKKELYNLERQDNLTTEEQARQTELQGQRQTIQQEFRRFLYSEEIQNFVKALTPNEIDWNVRLASLEGLQDNLAQLDNAVLLYPLILEDRLELVLMTPFGPPIHRSVNVTDEDLADQIGAFRFALEDPTLDARAPAQQLYEWLIQPIEDDLADANAKTIIYAPDGPLRYVPLAALYDPNTSTDDASSEENPSGEDGEWLIERFRINHITALSLSDLTSESSGNVNILAGALTSAIDVTVGGQPFQFDDLPFAEEEVEGLSQMVQRVTPLLDTDFSRASIEQEANRHTILHLATHAKFLIGQPEDSFIVFGDGSHVTLSEMKYEGWLSFNQMDLVVLSACETAIGSDLRDASGEEILGFGYLMEQAGARASIASLWAVDDGGTQLLMTAFYDALERGNLTKVEALQRAQRVLIHAAEDDSRGSFAWALGQGDSSINPEDLSHPYYWAPFILIGNGL